MASWDPPQVALAASRALSGRQSPAPSPLPRRRSPHLVASLERARDARAGLVMAPRRRWREGGAVRTPRADTRSRHAADLRPSILATLLTLPRPVRRRTERGSPNAASGPWKPAAATTSREESRGRVERQSREVARVQGVSYRERGGAAVVPDAAGTRACRLGRPCPPHSATCAPTRVCTDSRCRTHALSHDCSESG